MILAKDKAPQKDYDKKTRYPKHRITLYLMLFYEAFWRIIGANLLFILFCIPIVTIPAAIGGLTRVMSRFARDEQAYVIDDFMKGFKQEWKKNTAFAAIQLAFIALADFFVLADHPVMSSDNHNAHNAFLLNLYV